jgi:hypothetical protein
MPNMKKLIGWTAVGSVLLGCGWSGPMAWADEKLHILAGLGGGVADYAPSDRTTSNFEFAAEGSVALEYSLLTDPVELRLGMQGDWTRSTNLIYSGSDHRGFGVYGKLKVAFAYGGLGWKRVHLKTLWGPEGAEYDTGGWLPFQLLGLEFKILKFSLHLEYQHTGGTFKDVPGTGASFRYRRHMGRLLVGLHL